PEELKSCLRKDVAGWGYHVFLPWTACRPEISRVQWKWRFEPVNGATLFAESGIVVLHYPHDLAEAKPGPAEGVRTLFGLALGVECSSDPARRIRQLLNQSEGELRRIEDEWEQFWRIDHPSHLTYDRIDGSIE